MTYKEFMQWAEENEELKAIIPDFFKERHNMDDVMERLAYIDIFPNRYTNVPFSHGCYQDKMGNWYYYIQIDERTSLTPNGTKYPEEECFEKLKSSVGYAIQEYQARERQEQERLANMSPERKQRMEREEKLLRNFHLVMNMFGTEIDETKTIEQLKTDLNKITTFDDTDGDDEAFELIKEQYEIDKAKTIKELKIDLNKIYTAFDDTDEDNETFKLIKEQYGEEKGIKLLKIFKFITYYGMALQRIKFVTYIDELIVQKVNQIFVEMLMYKD